MKSMGEKWNEFWREWYEWERSLEIPDPLRPCPDCKTQLHFHATHHNFKGEVRR